MFLRLVSSPLVWLNLGQTKRYPIDGEPYILALEYLLSFTFDSCRVCPPAYPVFEISLIIISGDMMNVVHGLQSAMVTGLLASFGANGRLLADKFEKAGFTKPVFPKPVMLTTYAP